MRIAAKRLAVRLLHVDGDWTRLACVRKGGKPKRCYSSYVYAWIDIYSLMVKNHGNAHMRFPYRCAYGHIHIGALPNPSRMLNP